MFDLDCIIFVYLIRMHIKVQKMDTASVGKSACYQSILQTYIIIIMSVDVLRNGHIEQQSSLLPFMVCKQLLSLATWYIQAYSLDPGFAWIRN